MANLQTTVGYGAAGFGIVTSLQRLGHHVPFKSPEPPVEIAFNQPIWTEWSGKNQYRIQYTPWESSALPDGWLKGFQEADEVWTTSPLVAQWYAEAGVTRPIHVYEHGIDHAWKPLRRSPSQRLHFLHIGEPAPRKGGQMAVDAFRAAFGSRTDVHLTIKSSGAGPQRIRRLDSRGNIIGTIDSYNNVSVIGQTLSEERLMSLYAQHHVLVYPGWGEGFGLIPLQGMATGMPTICTGAWAPYRELLVPGLDLDSSLTDSPWPLMHPGKMFSPNFDHLVQMYLDILDNYDTYAGVAYKNAFAVHERYDWDRLTEKSWSHIVEKFT